MALDPRQTFGKVGATAFKAPQTAQLVPENTPQSASLVGQAAAHIGDSIQTSLETIRKSGVMIEKQNLESMGAAMNAREAKVRLELQEEEMNSGRKYSPEELTKNYNEKLDREYVDVSKQYSFDFIPDERDTYRTRWKEASNAQFTTKVIQPRMAELNQESLMKEVQGHIDTSASLTQAGDVDGALSAARKAAEVYDRPNAAVAWNPAQRAALKEKTVQDGFKNVLFAMDPAARMDLIRKDAELKKASSESGDALSAMASPLRGVDPAFIATLTKHTESEIHQETERKRVEANRARAELTDKFQFGLTDFMTDSKTTAAALSKRKFELVQMGRDIVANNTTDGPTLDAVTAGVRQLDNEIESRQRKAEAAAAKAQKAADKRVNVANFLTSNQVVDPTDKVSRDLGNAAFATLEQVVSKLPVEEQNQKRLQLIGQLKYIPPTYERQISQALTSTDPKLQQQAMSQLKAIQAVSPEAFVRLPEREQKISTNVLRNGMSLELAIKSYDADNVRSDEEKRVVRERAEKQIGSDKAPYNAQKVIKESITGPSSGFFFGKQTVGEVPIQAEAAYNAAFKEHFATNGGNPDAASKSAVADLQKEFSVSTTTGKPVLRQKQPVAFGITPDSQQQQIADYLKSKGAAGNEPYRLTFTGELNGTPMYGLEMADKNGNFRILKDAAGLPAVIALDKQEKIRPPVVVKQPGLAARKAEQTGATNAGGAAFTSPKP